MHFILFLSHWTELLLFKRSFFQTTWVKFYDFRSIHSDYKEIDNKIVLYLCISLPRLYGKLEKCQKKSVSFTFGIIAQNIDIMFLWIYIFLSRGESRKGSKIFTEEYYNYFWLYMESIALRYKFCYPSGSASVEISKDWCKIWNSFEFHFLSCFLKKSEQKFIWKYSALQYLLNDTKFVKIASLVKKRHRK